MEEPLKERGSILIVSLWLLTLLALISVTLAYTAGLETRLAGRWWGESRLVAAARDAVFLVGDDLKRHQPPPYRSLGQPWAGDPGLFQERALPGGGTFTLERFVDGENRPGLDDENARININAAPAEVLEALFGEEVSHALQDWRDPDDAPRPLGAEKDHTPGYLPRNGALRRVEELLLVKGVTPDIFRRTGDWITVYGNGRVNVNTASGDVLRMLGMEPSLIEKVLLFRRGPDGVSGSEDDGVVQALAGLPAALDSVGGLSGEEGASLQKALQGTMLGTESDALRMNFLVSLEEGRLRNRFRVTIDPKAWPPKIWAWREGVS